MKQLKLDLEEPVKEHSATKIYEMIASGLLTKREFHKWLRQQESNIKLRIQTKAEYNGYMRGYDARKHCVVPDNY